MEFYYSRILQINMPDYPSAIDHEGWENPTPFGPHVRALRKAAGLTLEQVSAASGMSRAALSRIERGEMSPTYESLLKLAHGLEMDLAALVSGRRQAGGSIVVTPSGEGAEYRDEHFMHRLLAPDLPDRGFYTFITEVRATKLEEYEAWDRHDSEDFLYVLDGAVAVYLEDRQPVELRRGDSMQMDGRIAHALIARPRPGSREPGEKPAARLLWVSMPRYSGSE